MSILESLRARASATADLLREIRYDLADDGRINSAGDVLRATAKASLIPPLRYAVDVLEGVKIPGLGRRLAVESANFSSLEQVNPGEGQNHNQTNLAAASGRPEGRGDAAGSTRVVSFGKGGSGISTFATPAFNEIAVFGNEFQTGGVVLQPEPASVEVSPDGQRWYPLLGTAGGTPTYINSENMLDPFDPAAGGTRFSLAQAGVPAGMGILYVRVTDLGQGQSGFDLAGIAGR